MKNTHKLFYSLSFNYERKKSSSERWNSAGYDKLPFLYHSKKHLLGI